MYQAQPSTVAASVATAPTKGRFFKLTSQIMERLAALNDPAAAMVYLAIAQHADNPRGQWDLSEEQIAKEAGVSVRTVRRKAGVSGRKDERGEVIETTLVKAGLIAVEPTFSIEGRHLTAAEVRARTGGKLVKTPNAKGKGRWELVRPTFARTGIERIPVGQGFNRYTLLLRPGARTPGPGVGTDWPAPSGRKARTPSDKMAGRTSPKRTRPKRSGGPTVRSTMRTPSRPAAGAKGR